MLDPIPLLESWPGLGPGNHSKSAEKHNYMIWSLATTVKELIKRIDDQDRVIQEQKQLIETLTSNQTKQNEISAFSYSNLVASFGKKSETDLVLLAKVHSELKEKSRIERNIIISGLDECVGSSDAEKELNEKAIVDEVLVELKISNDKVKRRTRLRKRGVENNDPSKPSLLLVEFTDSISKTMALANSPQLKRNTKFKNIYVNSDKTMAERAAEAQLRQKRNEMNRDLPFTEGILRYGVNEKNNKRFYWGIRDGRLVQLEPREIMNFKTRIQKQKTNIKNKKKKLNQSSINNYLKCFETNATSLVNKLNELQIIINTYVQNVIAITETWFNNKSNRSINNYTSYIKDRGEMAGGGVALFIRNDVDSCEVDDIRLQNTSGEQVWCQLNISEERILIGAFTGLLP
ncbi:RNA-directed DNA polymerase from mobile element jockey [Brachionus plicatilis]|uniref:RNA-directed DNA polymerase from mobile element jockey n=1 Tax=Brachionus plicatilis TaxID=10195 RepID=A0A3M7QTX4_BRAPC|nr:RNA-directed DNA polymerase from mobile element jockey [Brachionus plicatilis]